MKFGYFRWAAGFLRRAPMLGGALAAALWAGAADAQTPGFAVRMTQYSGPLYPLLSASGQFNQTGLPAPWIAFEAQEILSQVNMNGGNDINVFDGDDPWLNGSVDDNSSYFTVTASANVRIPAGTWSIAVGSDDGGGITIPGVTFDSRFNTNGPQPPNGAWFPNQRGHTWTGGTFTLTEPLETTLFAAMYEFEGGDAFELAVAQGATSDLTNLGQLLTDGALGWQVTTTELPGMWIGGSGYVGTLSPAGSLENAVYTGGGDVTPGLTQAWYGGGNPGDLQAMRDYFDANDPVVPPFKVVAPEQDNPWWTGSAGPIMENGQVAVQKYPDLVESFSPFPGSPNNFDEYKVHLTGEIFFPEPGIYQFKDGVDDFTYLNIGGQELVNDNNWTGVFGGDNGGSPIVTYNATAAGWQSFEFIVSEGGGGDAGILYWDWTDAGPGTSVDFPFSQDEQIAADAAAGMIIRNTHLRSTAPPELQSADLVTSLGSGRFTEFDVQDSSNDRIELASPLPGVITSKLDVEGATVAINVAAEGISAGTVVDLVDVDEITGSLAGFLFRNSQASDWDVSNFATDGTIRALNDINPGGVTPGLPGDLDGDDDVDTADLNTLILNWTGAQAGNLDDGDHADLIYDPATGEVRIDASDTPSGKIISFVLINDAGQMTPVADGRLPFAVTPVNTDNLPKQIGQADLSFAGVAEADLGPIFPPGMNKDQLFEFLSTADYAYAPGGGGALDLIVVPEPGSLALVSLGLLGLVRTIRRRRAA